MSADKTYLQWFDTSVFTSPAANTFGTRTRNMGDIRGPRYTNLDFSLIKQFGFGGSRSGEFRMDIWNLPNTIHMSNPNTTYLNAHVRPDHQRLQRAPDALQLAVHLLGPAHSSMRREWRPGASS